MGRYRANLLSIALILFIAISGTVRAEPDEFNYLRYSNGDSICSIGAGENYVIISSQLPANFKSVSVNGDEVEIVDLSCVSRSTTLGSLTSAESQSLESAKSAFFNVLNNIESVDVGRNGLIQIIHQTSWSRRENTSGGGSIYLMGNNREITNYIKDTGDFSLTRDDLPNNWTRLMVQGDLVTTQTRDGKIRARCESALEDSERKFVAQIREDIKSRLAQIEVERQQRQQRQLEREQRHRERESERQQRQSEREQRHRERESERQQRQSEREQRHRERESERQQRKLDATRYNTM